MSDLTTLADAQLAERAAKAQGWNSGQAGPSHQPECKRWFNSRGYAEEYCHNYSPATNIAQAWLLQRAAVEKCGAIDFRNAMSRLWLDRYRHDIDKQTFLATADARARTIAAVAVLEGKSDA